MPQGPFQPGAAQALTGACTRALTAGWRLGATLPGLAASPSALAGDMDWQQLDALSSVAAAWLGAGRARPEGGFDASDWWYQCTLPDDVPASVASWRLQWPGLATRAEIWLDDERVADSCNQFLAGEVVLGQSAQWQGRTLSIVCRSLDHALTAKRPRPSWKAPMVRHQQLRWWRTSLWGRSSSWTPDTPLIGPTGPLVLHGQDAVEVLAWRWQAWWTPEGGRLRVRAHGQLQDELGGQAMRVSLRLKRPGADAGACKVLDLPLTVSPDATWQIDADVPVPGIDAWWPHTHGEPVRYQATLVFVGPDGAQRWSGDLAPIGFRQVTLDTTQGDFRLAINGRDVFARGVNLLPPDPWFAELDAAGWRAALQPYVDAGMNMLRIPGNMAYGSEGFFCCCDELGLMVWQDFMFSNMDYPGDDETFLAEVRREVLAQVDRLEGHPSLVLWCGNSEVSQQALMYAAPRARWMPPLFHQHIPAWLQGADSMLPYWPSSVHGGSFPCRADVGTTSYYGVGVYKQPLEDARRSGLRFATECLGLANEPMVAEPAGWVPNDPAIGGDFVAVRDHYLQMLFAQDATELAARDPQRYRDLSRITSAEVMAAAFEEWRRDTSPCRGALIWFGRDVQPGAGFGILDHAGHPKAPYHALRRVLAPRALSVSNEAGNGLFVHALNETAQVASGQLTLTLYRADGSRVDAGQLPLTVAPWSCVSLPAEDAFDWFLDLSWAYRFGPPVAHVLALSWADDAGCVLAEHVALPAGRDLPQQDDLGWQVSVLAHDGSMLRVSIGVQRFAQSVLVDADGWHADDQAFHLLPGQPRVVTLRRDASVGGRMTIRLQAVNTPRPHLWSMDGLGADPQKGLS